MDKNQISSDQRPISRITWCVEAFGALCGYAGMALNALWKAARPPLRRLTGVTRRVLRDIAQVHGVTLVRASRQPILSGLIIVLAAATVTVTAVAINADRVTANIEALSPDAPISRSFTAPSTLNTPEGRTGTNPVESNRADRLAGNDGEAGGEATPLLSPASTDEPTGDTADVQVLSTSTGAHDYSWVHSAIRRAAEHAVIIWQRDYQDRWGDCGLTTEFLISAAWMESRPWWSDLRGDGWMDPPLVNKWGAQGPWQFIPETWRQFGRGGDPQNAYDAALAAMRYSCFLAESYPEGLDDRATALQVAVDYHDGPGRDRAQSARCFAGEDLDTRACAGERYASDRLVVMDRLRVESGLRAIGAVDVDAGSPVNAFEAAPAACQTIILGDSLSVGAGAFVDDEFAARGLPQPVQTAQIGRSLMSGAEELRQAANGEPVELVLVALGTNDSWLSRQAARDAIADIEREAGSRDAEVRWVEVTYQPASWLNDLMTAPIPDPSAERHTADDGVHREPSGYRLRAAVYADIAADVCGSRTLHGADEGLAQPR